jgi:hypothetical protein
MEEPQMSSQSSKLRLSSVSGFFILIIMMMAVSAFSAPGTEEELVKTLVGKWEGILLVREGYRTLVIQPVKRDGDQWIARGRFGVTGKKGFPVGIKVTVDGGNVTIDFDVPLGPARSLGPARLKLEGDNELNGYVRRVRPEGASYKITRLTLKKVE